ncbi:CBS domain-containing protein [Marinovum sp.]|uniref:CBS domain-containing protein n=1 Tax=Marinovum sp. TaxID=2024839 RepID=UPI003A956519
MTAHKVGSILRRDAPTLTPLTPIRTAVSVLVEAQADGAAVLGEGGDLQGILTQKDCFRPALHAAYYQKWTGVVGHQMTRDVVTVDIHDEVIEAADMFLNHPHRLFPVMDGPRVAGLLYRLDVLALLARLG